jgi:elongation factor Tu
VAERLYRASLNVVPTERGGRKTPFVVGYRPQFHISGSDHCTSFMIKKIEGTDQMAPGDAGTVEAVLLFPDALGVPVTEGATFELREGHTVIARGLIQAIL